MVGQFNESRRYVSQARKVLTSVRKMLVWFLSHPIWTGIGGLAAIVVLVVSNIDISMRNGPSVPPNDPPISPGVYSLRGLSAGERLIAIMVKVRGDVENVTHRHPVRIEDVIGFCLTENVHENTRLTLTHLERCSIADD